VAKRIRATDAKNNFGGMLEDVALHGRVEIVRHGRVVAIVLSPSELAALPGARPPPAQPTHMIPPELARDARLIEERHDFGEDDA
jgi:prevent-host-death family protein